MSTVSLNITIDADIKEIGETILTKTGITWSQLLEEAICLREPNQDYMEEDGIKIIPLMESALIESEKLGDYPKQYSSFSEMLNDVKMELEINDEI